MAKNNPQIQHKYQRQKKYLLDTNYLKNMKSQLNNDINFTT